MFDRMDKDEFTPQRNTSQMKRNELATRCIAEKNHKLPLSLSTETKQHMTATFKIRCTFSS